MKHGHVYKDYYGSVSTGSTHPKVSKLTVPAATPCERYKAHEEDQASLKNTLDDPLPEDNSAETLVL